MAEEKLVVPVSQMRVVEDTLENRLAEVVKILQNHKETIQGTMAQIVGLNNRLNLLVEYMEKYGLEKSEWAYKLNVTKLVVFSQTKMKQLEIEAKERAELAQKFQEAMGKKNVEEEAEEKKKVLAMLEREREKLVQEREGGPGVAEPVEGSTKVVSSEPAAGDQKEPVLPTEAE